MGSGLEMTVLTIGCSRNQLADGTVVNFQVTPIALLVTEALSFLISRPDPGISKLTQWLFLKQKTA